MSLIEDKLTTSWIHCYNILCGITGDPEDIGGRNTAVSNARLAADNKSGFSERKARRQYVDNQLITHIQELLLPPDGSMCVFAASEVGTEDSKHTFLSITTVHHQQNI